MEGKLLKRLMRKDGRVKIGEWIKELPGEIRETAQDCFMKEEEKVREKDILNLAIRVARESIQEERRRLTRFLKEKEGKRKEGKEEEAVMKRIVVLDKKESKIIEFLV